MPDNDPNRTKKNNAAIIGGVVIAVLVLVYFLFGLGDNTDYPAPDTTGTVEAPESTVADPAL